jgi:hypothetical protein
LSGALTTREERREAFISFADKFDALDDESQSEILSFLHELNDEWDLSPSQIADLEQALIEDDAGDYASLDAVQQMFAPLKQ